MYFDISKLVSVANVQFALHFQSHKLFTIIPYKTDSKNFTSCRELQWKTEENFTSKLQKQCPLNIHIYIILYIYIYIIGRVAQSLQRLTTGWVIRDRIPVGTKFFPVQTGPGDHPAYSTICIGFFPRVECGPGRAADRSPPSSAAVMEEQSYSSNYLLRHTRPVTGPFYHYMYITCRTGQNSTKYFSRVE